MKIAIYTLTRDRLEYTMHCFASLKAKAWNYAYDHFVLDNGSTDGTIAWLRENELQFKKVIYMPENFGISKGSNTILKEIFDGDYDLIIKMDNDCEVISDNILQQMVEIFEDAANRKMEVVLSPRVIGIINQPYRAYQTTIGGRDVGITGIVGGLFHVVPVKIYRQYKYPVKLPKAWGQDDDFCHWLNKTGRKTGYVEGLIVNHYETTSGQAQRFPEYFERKWKEEKE
jgi:GT2 family glycosyltransferase